MSNKQEFIKYVMELMDGNVVDMNEQAAKYWANLQVERPEKEKPMFTDNGKIIIEHMKQNIGVTYTSKEIADALLVSSRTVSGAMRKLITDGFVEKAGEDPVVYKLTEKGIEVEVH